MAFNYKIRPEIDMEDEGNDDDIFYAEIRRQILLLTAEEDEDNGDLPGTKNSSSARSTKLCSGSGWSAALLPGSYFTWSETQESANVPAWLVSLWRSGNGGNGTGVFIPHIVKSRRQQRPKERNNGRGRMYKPVAYKNE
ncbi:uncharacterized protein LOC127798086 [Diospyros lotus]|uniref:uncharacterized protein LOC127798086 n=1 Tax=Diospyros lotus TaxID=55363 RepID=UPI00225363D4|nr:uncharacterized protein LOC127798086 [Diospyros lotus]